MKRFPKLIQCDSRGQIVIPKDIRSELKISDGTGFWVYSIEDEGLFLKKVEPMPLDKHTKEMSEIEDKAEKIGVKKANLLKSVEKYRKTKEGRLDLL
ncbi:MAG: AbrB/MazE/SpoVT family DNA-binding domain-containing protein [Candidatus Woesearchaeota archaeon]